MSELSERILALRAEGKSYRQIEAELGCAKSTVAYYCSEEQRKKAKARVVNLRASNGLVRKVEVFKRPTKVSNAHPGTSTAGKKTYTKVSRFQGHVPVSEQEFSFQDVVDKHGDSPVCYLTGDPVDYNDPSSYHFDHIVPRSRGGENTLSNLGLATKQANQMKGDMSLEEFLDACEKVLRHHGRM